MQRGDVRHYERQANNARSSHSNGNRMSVGKNSSGKRNLFILFLNKVGRSQFRNIYGEKYDDSIADHKDFMTKLYQEFRNPVDEYGKAQLAGMVQEIEDHNSDTAAVRMRKQQQDRERRQQRHENPQGFIEKRSVHVTNLRNQPRISVNTPSKIDEIITDEDTVKFYQKNKKTMEQSVQALIRTSLESFGNPICSRNFNVHVISLFPILYLHKINIGRICCFPAEIAVTSFNLVDGILSNESKFVKFDQVFAFGPLNEATDGGEIENLERNKNHLGSIIGANELQEDRTEAAVDVFRWLETTLEKYPGSKLVVFRDQFRFVYNGIKMLAAYNGFNGQHYFVTKIANRLVTIEDFTNVILKEAPFHDSTDLEDGFTEKHFQDYQIVPIADKGLFCEFHENSPKPTKYHCMKAQNARLIHVFFRIMRLRKLQNFDFSPVHDLCIVDRNDPSLPQTIMEPSIKNAKRPSDIHQSHPHITTPHQYDDRDNDNHGDSEFDEEDDDFDMSVRPHQTQNIVPSHYPHQERNDISSRSQQFQDSVFRSFYNYEHQEIYVDQLQNGSRADHNVNFEMLRHSDERLAPSNNFGYQSRGDVPHNNNGIIDYGAGTSTGERRLADAPTNRAEDSNQEHESLAHRMGEVALNSPKAYVESPSCEDFEVPTLSNYVFNSEETSRYLKMAKKGSTKTFTRNVLLEEIIEKMYI